MSRISSLIRYDGEFSHSILQMKETHEAKTPLPIVINGLSGGALTAYIVESVRELNRLTSRPALIIAANDGECEKFTDELCAAGINAKRYKPRDLVFHNISASHDRDRERLSVLLSILRSELNAVVTTASAALGYTMPSDVLADNSISVGVGDEIAPAALAEKLTALGFARVDMVEAPGQFSVRGGILDLWRGADQPPVRVEFFGDEVDRMVHFDAASQRSDSPADRFEIIPAREVLISDEARSRVISEINKLKKKADKSEALEKLNS